MFLKTSLSKMIKKLSNFEQKVYIDSIGCCSLEIENIQSPIYDWKRIHLESQEAIEECDMLLVSGWINKNRSEEIKKAYECLVGSKLVVAVGACAISASVFQHDKELFPLDSILPVNLYIPGCPPKPEQLLKALYEYKKLLHDTKERSLYEALR